jgi:hypothetical protein
VDEPLVARATDALVPGGADRLAGSATVFSEFEQTAIVCLLFVAEAGLAGVPQFMHGVQAVNDRAVSPLAGKGRKVDEHGAGVEAGWTLAFSSTNASVAGTIHQFQVAGTERIYPSRRWPRYDATYATN